MAEYIGKRIIPKHGGAWDKTKAYEPLVIVLAESGDSYTSRREVPAGTELTNTEYWALSARFDAQLKETYDNMTGDMQETLKTMEESFAKTQKEISTDLSETHEAITKELTETHEAVTKELTETHGQMSEELSETEENLSAKVDAATKAADSSREDMNEAVETINARLDSIVKESTKEDADYSAELADARVDSTGEEYECAGDAMRSITEGIPAKINPADAACIKQTDSNTVSAERKGRVIKCQFSKTSDGGYVGFFFSYFGKSESYGGKKYRVVIKGEDLSEELSLEAMVTNQSRAWGSKDGSVKVLALPAVRLREENGYMVSIDVDFASDEVKEYLETLTDDPSLYFCIRKQSGAVASATFYVYAYEVEVAPGFFWKYVSDFEEIEALKTEIEAARDDGTEHDTLSDMLAKLRSRVSDAETELEGSHTDSRGTEFKALSERLDSYDCLVLPRFNVNAVNAPRDNKNGDLSKLCSNIYGEKNSFNGTYHFDYAQYTSLENPQWSSLNFSFSVANSKLSALTDLSKIYLELKLEQEDGTEAAVSHNGEALTVGYYVNSTGSWGSTVNKARNDKATIGEKSLINIPAEEITNVLETEKDLYIVFIGTFLNNTAIAGMGRVKITASLLNRAAEDSEDAYMGYAEAAGTALYAETAGTARTAEEASHAETADEADYADSADIADNFFLNSASDLLNIEGKRYSPYMDAADVPEKSPYNMRYSFQSIISGGYKGTQVENGFSPYVQFDLTLSASSDQPKNQGYVKQLTGMISFDDFIAKIQEGYKSFFVCAIEDCISYPEDTKNGSHPQNLLISYASDSQTRKTLFGVRNPDTKRQIGDGLLLTVWECTVTDAILEEIAAAQAEETFKPVWFGIWNTREYTGETDIPWSVKWFWQDCAFTDGSYSVEEMMTFFQSKYTYWASMVNHPTLVKQFASVRAEIEANKEEADGQLTALDTAVKELDTGVEKANTAAEAAQKTAEETKTEVETELSLKQEIVCWGDSLTAGGGWTTTLQKLSGLTVYNGGTGGEGARTIVARQGADVMTVNNITIPAECEAVTIAERSTDTGITTEWGYKVTPLLQGGAHVNPVKIGDVEGTLKWTGSNYADKTGIWTFTRTTAGDAVEIKRPTAIRTAFDRNHNNKNSIMVIFIGQNGGYSDLDDLVRQHKMMIDHCKGKEYVVLGLSSGTTDSRKDYEAAMKEAFGRRFISLREYLACPIYDTDGETVISCYGLDDAGLDATDDDIEKIKVGQVPKTLLSDSVHYTAATKTVIGTMLYKKMVELGILG